MPCLTTDTDRTVFLGYLRDAIDGTDFQLHAFVLMGNHVHLLATGRSKGIVSKVMHSVGLRYAGYFNRRHDRRGPLFQGRFWASVIETERYLFEAMRYIELNPVRAGLVDSPADFPWSSFAHNTGRSHHPVITPHEQYLGLGRTDADRWRSWADYVSEGVSQDQLERIRKQFRRNHPYGTAEFEARIRPRKARTAKGTKGDGSE